MYTTIKKCRISGSTNLIEVLSLGEQFLTGVFPKTKEEPVTKGPLDLLWCPESGLLQLKHSYSPEEMYGTNYGYRSGLNRSMIEHLKNKVKSLESQTELNSDDLVIDIGSNDATTLKAYTGKHGKVGIDPVGLKYKHFYPRDITLIPDFFSAELFKQFFPGKLAKIITSIAMFYDLEDPAAFTKDIEKCLADDGIWHFEQSYMPSMLRTNAYDTICHEHLEFYSLKVVKKLLEDCNMRVLDVQLNAINGGSFAVTACKTHAPYSSNNSIINWMIQQEDALGLHTLKPYIEFSSRVHKHRKSLRVLIQSLIEDGKKILGYGASTKGNVLLQFCQFSSKQIPFIAEVNEDKYGCFTPGTHIPIIPEREARAMNPDYFLVLPWHFKHSILEREKKFISNGGRFIFPLPEIEIF